MKVSVHPQYGNALLSIIQSDTAESAQQIAILEQLLKLERETKRQALMQPKKVENVAKSE